MKKKAPIREKLISNLYEKFGKNVFTFTDLQREIVTLNGHDYDETENYPTYDAFGNMRFRRKYRGWYCGAIYPIGAYYKNSTYLYDKNKNGLRLTKVARGRYQLV